MIVLHGYGYGELAEQSESLVAALLPDAPIMVWWPHGAPKNARETSIGRIAHRRKLGGSSFRFARSYTAGMSFLRARSPVTPKNTRDDGPATRDSRRSRGSRSGLCPDLTLGSTYVTNIVAFYSSTSDGPAVRPSTDGHESVCSQVSPKGTVLLSSSVYRPGL